MTGESKTTEGPWFYQEESDAYTHIVRAPNNRMVCQLSQDTSGRAESEARLIAAAPDLLEALKIARAEIEATGEREGIFFGDDPQVLEKIDAAIAKAESQQ